MIVEIKAKTTMVGAALVVGGVGVGAAVASAAAAHSSSPAAQPSGQYVFACVNKDGAIDYLQFHKPLPHQCWYSGETLWHWAAAPGSAAPPASPSPSPYPSASSSASASTSPLPAR
jgi:hypothetical protein